MTRRTGSLGPFEDESGRVHLGLDLSALVDGELDHDRRDSALVHASDCWICLGALEVERELKGMLASLPEPPVSDALTARLLAVPYSPDVLAGIGTPSLIARRRPPGPHGGGRQRLPFRGERSSPASRPLTRRSIGRAARAGSASPPPRRGFAIRVARAGGPAQSTGMPRMPRHRGSVVVGLLSLAGIVIGTFALAAPLALIDSAASGAAVFRPNSGVGIAGGGAPATASRRAATAAHGMAEATGAGTARVSFPTQSATGSGAPRLTAVHRHLPYDDLLRLHATAAVDGIRWDVPAPDWDVPAPERAPASETAGLAAQPGPGPVGYRPVRRVLHDSPTPAGAAAHLDAEGTGGTHGGPASGRADQTGVHR